MSNERCRGWARCPFSVLLPGPWAGGGSGAGHSHGETRTFLQRMRKRGDLICTVVNKRDHREIQKKKVFQSSLPKRLCPSDPGRGCRKGAESRGPTVWVGRRGSPSPLRCSASPACLPLPQGAPLPGLTRGAGGGPGGEKPSRDFQAPASLGTWSHSAGSMRPTPRPLCPGPFPFSTPFTPDRLGPVSGEKRQV